MSVLKDKTKQKPLVEEFSFNQQETKRQIDPNWILLDSQSIIDMFSNPDLLSNIRSSKQTMRVRGTGGVENTNMIGDLPGYGQVWYKEGGIANMLSLSRVVKIYNVTFDSNKGDYFIVHRPSSFNLHFCRSKEGLYYYDTRHEQFSMVHTVTQNKELYSERQVNQAEQAKRTYAMIGHPSQKDFENIIKLNILPDCPITVNDIKIAGKIFGTEIGSLKGKTTRRKPQPVRTDNVFVPPELVKVHKDVILVIDIMLVNNLPFFTSISRNLKFSTIQFLPNRKSETIGNALKIVKLVYGRGGFRIRTVLADGEFEHLRDICLELNVYLNTTSANEHVPEIERQIRIIKERARAIWTMSPFEWWPRRLVIELMSFVIFWLNSFPTKYGVSHTLSPRMIVTGSQLNFKQHCRMPFAGYAQTHEEHEPLNDVMIPRTQGCICMGPSGNSQGGYKFLSLTTGKKIVRRAFTELPMPDNAIACIHEFALNEKQGRNLTFLNRLKQPYEDEDSSDDEAIDANDYITGVEHNNYSENDSENSESDNEDETTNPIEPEIAVVETTELEFNNDDIKTPGVHRDPTENIDNLEATETENNENPEPNQENNDEDFATENESSEDEESCTDDGAKEIHEHEVYHPSTLTPSIQRMYGLRPNRRRNYSYTHQALTHIMLTQYGLNAGLKRNETEG